jgi:hypothetical protein
VSASLREQQQAGLIISGIFTSRLEALATGLKDRFAVYSDSRDSAINSELQRIVEAVQHAAVDFCRDPYAQEDVDVFSLRSDGDFSPGSPRSKARRRSTGQTPRQRARSAGAADGAQPRVALSPLDNALTGVPRGSGHPMLPSSMSAAHHPQQQQRKAGFIGEGSENAYPVRGGHHPLQRSYMSEDYRLVEYFTSLRAILSKAFEELDRRINHHHTQSDASRSAAIRHIHDSYLDASAAAMRALEDRQHAIDERDCAIVQLASRLEAKAAAEVRAAVLADDLAVLARKYDMLSRGWMLHASVAVPGRELERAADSPERQPPLEQSPRTAAAESRCELATPGRRRAGDARLHDRPRRQAPDTRRGPREHHDAGASAGDRVVRR